MHLNYLLYRVLTLLLSPIIIGHFIWLTLKNKESRYIWQRLGLEHSQLPNNAIWLHCASVGEVNTLIPLIKNLHATDNTIKVVISTNTITGGKTVNQKQLAYVSHCYLPFDWKISIQHFISKLKPKILFIMETEIWPTLYTVASKNNLPIYIINARLSDKTTKSNTWIKSLLKYSLEKVTKIYSRSEKDSIAYASLGANKDNIITLGNLKLTSTKQSTIESETAAKTIEKEYVLFASTHKDEEVQFYSMWKQLNRDELLIIAPRHPERGPNISKQLECKNIALRSNNDLIKESTEVYLLDSIGELQYYFKNAKVVVMGGSFTPVGGHNILEPALFNCAIITGPYMDNFLEEVDLLSDSLAIIHITSLEQPYLELKSTVAELLDNKNSRETLQNNTMKISHDAEKILNNYTRIIMDSIKL